MLDDPTVLHARVHPARSSSTQTNKERRKPAQACTQLDPLSFFAGSEHTIRLEQNTAQPRATVSLARPHLPSGLCQLTFKHKKGAPQTFIPPVRGGRGKSRQNYTFCPSAVPCHFGHPARAHIQLLKCCNSQQCVAWSQHAVTLLTRQPNQLTTNAR